MIKSENFIAVQGWMRTVLGLSGNELLCYALIYGFCQDGESSFTGSSKYICEWLGVSKPTALDILKRLSEKNLIEKKETIQNGVKFCSYKTLPVVKNLYQGGKETLPNNKDYKNKEDNNNILCKDENQVANHLANQDEKHLEIVQHLQAIVEKKKDREIRTNGWTSHIDKMTKLDHIPAEQIEKALDWYEVHFNDEYCPVIECGKTLREKFGKLENAMRKTKKEVDPLTGTREWTEEEMVEYLERTM
jgi:hypothetical protein